MEDYKTLYEQRLERAKEEIKKCGYNKGRISMIENIFPELRESEDERIRKDIIAYMRYERKSTEEEIENRFIPWLEKQCEQNPTDEIKPKFKVGDWIYHKKSGNTFYINKIGNGLYVSDIGATISLGRQNDWRLWTIKDAKDGDVLASDGGNVCLFDGTVEEGIYPFAYCGITRHGFEFYDRKLPFTHDYVYPATEEQRDLLFSKIKKAGYEWDSEKKELKKIEQTYFQEQEWTGYDEKAYEIALLDIDKSPSITKNDTIDWLKSLKNRVQLQPKQEWSKEDEHCIELLLPIIDSSSLIPKNRKKCKEFLKSIKPNHWKPSEEQMEAVRIAAEIGTANNSWAMGVLKSMYQDLKKLKE